MAEQITTETEPCNRRFTDTELVEWAQQQRRDYHADQLSADKIKKLEALEGWRWGPGPRTAN